MLKSGEIVEACVYRAEPYGIFLRHAESEIFVDILELSWTERGPANRRNLTNKLINVKLLQWNEKEKRWAASVRRANPDGNPYLIFNKSIGEVVFVGTVEYKTSDAALIVFPNEARGWICREDSSRDLQIGEKIDTIVKSLNIEDGRLNLLLKQ